jgi:Family of unknown function (DUF695)
VSKDTVKVIVPNANPVLFDCQLQDLPAVVVVNEALLSFPHLDVFPWHLCVTITAVDLAENGMPSIEESKLLFLISDEIENAAIGCLASNGGKNALFLARSIWNERRELHFRIHDAALENGVLGVLSQSKTWARAWEFEMEYDLDCKLAGRFFKLFVPVRGANA